MSKAIERDTPIMREVRAWWALVRGIAKAQRRRAWMARRSGEYER